MFNKILVPTDGSEYSRRALSMAIEIARKFDSEILLLHVAVTPEALGYVLSKDATVVQDAEVGGKSVLEATCHDIDTEGVRLNLKQNAGHPVTEILHEISMAGIDLVVLGFHGYSPIKGTLMGSVSQKVSIRTEKPVLLVK